MGVLTAAGSLARFLGPIFVTNIYSKQGPTLAISLVALTMVITLAMVLPTYKRLVPFKMPPGDDNAARQATPTIQVDHDGSSDSDNSSDNDEK